MLPMAYGIAPSRWFVSRARTPIYDVSSSWRITMPLVRISLRRGKSSAHITALRHGIYQAMRETFNVPENDRFILVSQHDADEFDYDPIYLGIARSDDLVIVQITCNSGRTVEQKQALYRRIAENFSAGPGLRPEDVFINLVEVAKENWSFGNGIAQYA
jgi:phenylpyruvate tautomerase PptA (4-oxalocrotonate tautomerase family)